MTETDPRPFAALPAPEKDEAVEAEPRARRSLFPDGALGIFVLLILAAVSGGLIAAYWPWVQGGEASNDRLTTLESRVGQIAAGRAPTVAAAAYGDEQKSVAALKMRLDADEARLTAMEKSTGQIDGSDTAALKSDLDLLDGRVAKLEQNPGGVAPLRKELETRAQTQADAIGRLSERVASLEKNAPPADLAARLDGFALKTGEDALETRVVRLEGQNASDVMKHAATLLALADLVRASAGGESFGTELQTMRALSPTAPELGDLSKYANRGAPTRAVLATQLSGEADAILAAERASQAQGWTGRLWANLANLVSIRRVGGVSGDSTESRLARAENDLRTGDLDRAAGEMNALRGAARNAASGWIGQAEARLAVDRDTRSLTARVIASMSEHS
ncbi:MAG TPA: mitofilin family membrane protein [Rhizomicrobium sp.]|jgi:hypothetical protein|nr:mitofilin family membrane protein [Rhizomicrobium sp.]